MKSYLPSFLFRPKGTKIPARTLAVKAPPVIRDPLLLPGDLLPRLNGLRRKHRLVGISTGMSKMLAALTVLLVLQAVSDWWFDLPWTARAGFLLSDFAVIGTIYRRELHRALRHRLGLAETALLVEKKWPQLNQSIIAAVELTEGKSYSTRGSMQLVEVMLQQARARSTGLNFNDVVPTRAWHRWMAMAAAAVLGCGALAFVTWPSSLPLLERICLLNVPLPTKTIVVPITRDLMVPVGSDVEISALAQGIIPTHGRVTITYAQGPPQDFPLNVLPDKPGTFSLTMHNVQTAFKYSFYLNDGHGPEFTVSAKVPPAISDLACEQLYPDYTGLPPLKLAPTELSLLAGSHLQIHAVSKDPLKSAKVVLQGMSQTIDVSLDSTGTQLQASIPIPAKDLTGFSIHLVDQTGVPSANETVYPISLVPDNPPVVKILEPADDHETITLRAKPVIAFDASDDYGLAKLTIHYQLIPPMIAGEEDIRPPSEVQSVPIPVKSAKEGHVYRYVLDVSSQTPPWQEGYTVNYWVEATDNNTATGPGITKTDHKQFGIISVEAKQAEILDRLKQNAAEINTLSDTQQKINTDVGEAIPSK
jgi:hypothetical protein